MKKTYKILLSVAIVLFVMGMIFFFSEQTGSQSHAVSKNLASRIASFWLSNMYDTDQNEQYEFLIRALDMPLRKIAHLCIYTLLGITTMSAFRFYFKRRTGFLHVLLCIVLIVIVATCDEINQFYSGGRGSSIRDVIIDTIGGAFGCYFTYLVTDFIRHINNALHRNPKDSSVE